MKKKNINEENKNLEDWVEEDEEFDDDETNAEIKALVKLKESANYKTPETKKNNTSIMRTFSTNLWFKRKGLKNRW